ncbi:MipA/OmpV family protein [Chromatiaceae bacterium AAb-1]|nr:MipA/OmpV family protein [Chromatiaceae bacterium AAb-1]
MPSLFSACSGYSTAFVRSLSVSVMAFGLSYPLTAVAAVQQADDKASSSVWGLGVVVLTSQKAYTDIDRNNTVIPVLTFENRYIRLLGPELEFRLPGIEINEFHKFNFSIVTKYDFNDYEQDDAWILNGMEERKGGFWAGAKAEWQNNYANISAEFISEVSGDSEGSRFNLGLERTWRFGARFTLTPRIVVSWLDKKYVDYYYGVRENEVRNDRSFYQGESAVSTEIGIRGGYMFNKKHLILLDIGVSSLASAIKDSPLVDSSTENRVFLGYIYYFR